jgi:hypothetical protein
MRNGGRWRWKVLMVLRGLLLARGRKNEKYLVGYSTFRVKAVPSLKKCYRRFVIF